jgi:hypothetical protein
MQEKPAEEEDKVEEVVIYDIRDTSTSASFLCCCKFASAITVIDSRQPASSQSQGGVLVLGVRIGEFYGE